MRVYLNNELITYLLRYIQQKPLQPNVQKEADSVFFLSNRSDIELLVSEESLAEIRRLDKDSPKRRELESFCFQKLKTTSVIRNSTVIYNDPITTYGSSGVFYGHSYDDDDLRRVINFLISKGNSDKFDARYIANAMLPENKIDILLTADKKTIWNYRDEIKEKFGVVVKLPSEINYPHSKL